jgi:hypothetical protein
LAKEKKAEAVKEIIHRLEKKDKEFEEKTSAIVSEALNDIQVGTQKDIKELNKEIADLEKILATNSNGNEQIHKEYPYSMEVKNMKKNIRRHFNNLKRYQEILRVFVKYGFNDIVNKISNTILPGNEKNLFFTQKENLISLSTQNA